MKHALAVDDPDTPFSHVAFKWEPDPGIWDFLCAGRTLDEFEHRVSYWISRGTDPASIRKYACTPPAAPSTQSELQAIEGESWGAWVGRLRAAQNQRPEQQVAPQPQLAERETLAEQAKLVQNAACQPVPISCELLNAISKQRPQAYFLLQKYNVLNAIITVGTSRTKLEFPTCPPRGHGGHDWSQFDRDNMHPHRPIIVLDGTPENGFKPMPGLRGLAGLT